MEKEKRKRGEKESKEVVEMEMEKKKKKKKKIRKEEEEVEVEVEEFYAILRRMKAVVKYFKRGGDGEGWRAAVEAETAVVVVDDDDDDDVKDGIDNDKRGEAVEANGVLDLNAAPEEEEEENPLS